MYEDLIKKILNNISLDTYEKLKKFTTIASISSNLAHWITVLAEGGLEYLTLPSVLFFWFLRKLFDNDKYLFNTRDIKELMILYKQFLQNYNLLIKSFNLKNPVEISTMFEYLLYNGLLSKDKKFEIEEDDVIDFKTFGSLNIFSGEGVCRHISLLLNDIFSEYGIKSERMLVYQRTKIMDDDCISLEDIDIEKIESEKIVNHAINYVEFEGIGYYLDVTQQDIYQKKDNSLFLSEEIENLNYIVSNSNYNYLISNTRKEDFQIKFKTKRICSENIDVLEKFYKDNKELYEDITVKSLILKPKKS